ncbi:DUF742 domain-containing protein [Streptomyces sp. NPDC051104]|uniref:DUF742 domain-containing protein n=1 Tax=Streptomyces sp. NPDC051104 TaxID=3155044 RepID=UPI00343B9AC8
MTAGDMQADGDAVTGRAADPLRRAPSVRPFLVTAGRVAGTTAATPMPLETQVVSTVAGIAGLERLAFEQRDIVELCRLPQSLAEVAAQLRLHLNVVRVLAEDLESAGHLSVYVPKAEAAHDLSVLRRVIDGLRAITDSRETIP